MSVDTSNAQAAAGVDSSRLRIAGAIKQAASSSGTSFEYLLATAKMESDFNPSAGASSSSAHGLFQFIDQTWLATVKEAGSQFGYGNYADLITKSSDGTHSVADPAARRAIMKLRDDPAIASAMAAALTQSNSFQLTGLLGRRPADSELYMAHFMGVGGAARLIGNAEDNPQASAARLFPNAAAANRSIFYDRSSGRARSVSEVYAVLQQRYASAASSAATQSAIAAVGGVPAPVAVASANVNAVPAPPVVDSAAYLSTFPDTRSIAPLTVAAASSPSTSTRDAMPAAPAVPAAAAVPMFRSLFQDGQGAQPVSQTVRALWGNSASLTADLPANSGTTTPVAPASGGRLDLFSDRNGTFSG